MGFNDYCGALYPSAITSRGVMRGGLSNRQSGHGRLEGAGRGFSIRLTHPASDELDHSARNSHPIAHAIAV